MIVFMGDSGFQPVDFHFLLQGTEFRIAGDQVGVAELGQGGGKTIGVGTGIFPL